MGTLSMVLASFFGGPCCTLSKHHLGYTKVNISIRKSWVPRFEPRATGWASVPRRPSAIRFSKKTYICFLILFLLSTWNYCLTLALNLVRVRAGSIEKLVKYTFHRNNYSSNWQNCSSKSICWKICRILQRNNKKQLSMEIKWDLFSVWTWDIV